MTLKKVFPLLLLVLIAFTAKAQEQTETNTEEIEHTFPEPKGVVSDFEGIFSDNQEKKLTDITEEVQRKTNYQIAIVTLITIEPYTDILDCATAIGNQWGVGKEGKDNGIVILMSMNSRQVAISTGEDVRDIITDDMVQQIIDNVMIPQFKKERFYLGAEKAIRKIMNTYYSANK